MELSYRNYDRKLLADAYNRRAPVVGSFELTSRCNLDCVMCFIRKSPGDLKAKAAELTAAQWVEIARQARDEGMLYLLLTGGEVLIRPDFFDILDGLSELGLKITINTNASLVTPEIARRLREYPIFSMAVTLYGASPETYQRVSGNAAGFEKTLNGIRLLIEQGFTLSLRTTIVRQNLEDHKALYRIADEFGRNLRINSSIYTCRDFCANVDEICLTPEEKAQCDDYDFRLKMAKAEVQRQARGEMEPEDMLNGPQVNPPEETERIPQRNAFPCAAGNYSFTVSPSGQMSVCMLYDGLSVPLLPDIDFKAAWEEIKRMSDSVPVSQECEACENKNICRYCPARLQSLTGSPDKKAEFLCEYTELIASGKYKSSASYH